VVPLIIDGLPAEIEALGRPWQRKREFHMTAILARALEDEWWGAVTRVASGRAIGPIRATDEVRRVRDPEQPDLQTLVVMVDCPGLEDLYRDLSRALDVDLTPPPAHVTLFSTDPAAGIGIADARELEARAPSLSKADREEVRRAMRFGEVF
jgi:hypothetical protein